MIGIRSALLTATKGDMIYVICSSHNSHHLFNNTSSYHYNDYLYHHYHHTHFQNHYHNYYRIVGTVVIDTQFDSYKPCVGSISQREKGSLLAFEQGS